MVKITQKEILIKLYNKEITENDVIVKKEKGEEYKSYIFNDGFDFYDCNGVISLRFVFKTDNYDYEIITTQKYKEIIEQKEKQEKIKQLELELKLLKG